MRAFGHREAVGVEQPKRDLDGPVTCCADAQWCAEGAHMGFVVTVWEQFVPHLGRLRHRPTDRDAGSCFG